MEAAPSKRIAVLAFPFTTHAAPLLSLVRRISAAAPASTRFTFFSTRASNASLFPSGAGDGNIEPRDVWDGVPEGHEFSGDPSEAVRLFMRAAPGNFRAAIAETGIEFRCLLTDAFLLSAADLAAEMKVPWIPFWTAGPRALFILVEVHKIRTTIRSNDPGDKTLDFLPDFSAIRKVDLPSGIVTGDPEAEIPLLINRIGEYLPRAAAVAINSFEELDPVVVNTLKSKLRNFLSIGPLALSSSPPSDSDEHGCLEFLDAQKPATVAYISFGSQIVPPAPELAAWAGVLEEKKIPFLWSFRGNPEKMLPEGFVGKTKDLGKIVPWAPQLRILRHASVGVFVTHGGWNSLTESVIGGVPLICRPFFGDQTVNVRTAEAIWRIGIGIDGGHFTRENTAGALEKVLLSEEGRKMKENIRKLQELAFEAVKSGGSSAENFKTLVDVISQI